MSPEAEQKKAGKIFAESSLFPLRTCCKMCYNRVILSFDAVYGVNL